MTGPAIDRARLDLICGDNLEMANQLIDGLLEEAEPLVEAIGHHIELRDAAGVREPAHSVKGMAGNVGAGALADAAAFLENGALAGASWEAMAAGYKTLAAAIVAVRTERAKTMPAR